MVASYVRISLLFHHLIRPWKVIGIYIRPGRVRYLSQVLGSIRCSHDDEFHIHGQTIVLDPNHRVPFFFSINQLQDHKRGLFVTAITR